MRKCRLDSLGADSGMPTRIKILGTRSQAFSLPHMHLCTKPGLCTAALPFVSYWKWLLPSRVASQLTCTVEGQQWLRSEQSPSKTAVTNRNGGSRVWDVHHAHVCKTSVLGVCSYVRMYIHKSICEGVHMYACNVCIFSNISAYLCNV